VRWEKVERLRLILAGGTYSVPPKRVAAKLLEQMLERDRANHRWERSKSGTTNDSSGISEALPEGNRNKRFEAQRAQIWRGKTSIAGKVT
jgi:Anti-sigma-28 factor, FlgM